MINVINKKEENILISHNKKRVPYLDVLRAIAILSVIIFHVIENTLNTYFLSGKAAIVYNIVAQIMYYAVPMFIMISGALFLNPKKEISIKELYNKYIKKIVIALILFGILYSSIEIYFNTKVISYNMITESIKNIITGNLWAHMWYIYLILGLYMITPILKKFTSTCTLKEYNYILALLFIFTIALVDIKSFFNINIAFDILIINPYIFLFMIGDYLSRFEINKKVRALNYIISMTFVVIIIFNNIYHFMNMQITYTTFGIISIVASIFLICKNLIKDNINYKVQKVFANVGKCGFGIYLIHQFFINIIFKLFKVDFILNYPFLGLLLYTSIIFILSYAIVYALRKIKFVAKYIL